MARLKYSPDQDIEIQKEGAIKLLCRAFQSHETGLPEWLKNSADAYAREDAPETRRVIVIFFDYGRKGFPPSISCLDFSGMTSAMIEENFRVWADPEAAVRGGKAVEVQGGHGNGGKCYMTQMFEEYSAIHTVKHGLGSRYGVVGGSLQFGYIPDRQTGRDFPVVDKERELEAVLKPIKCSLHKLPMGVVAAFEGADGFTFLTGVGPKSVEGRFPSNHLVEVLLDHPQMIRTLQLCKVYVIDNGKALNDGKPLALADIEPIPGAEQPRIIEIPQLLKDPASGEKVSTTNGGATPPGHLVLRCSSVSMRWKKKGRHNIVYKTKSGFVGYVEVSELDVQSPYRDHIYGECHLEAIEAFKQNDRARLARSLLTRALERFISAQIEAYAKEFEARDRRRYDQEEKQALSKMNEALDKWKNRFLQELMGGLWGGPGDVSPDERAGLPTGKPTQLDLTLSHPFAGQGVSFRPTLKFLDHSGARIRPVPFRWMSEDNNVAMVDDDLLIINTFAPGRTAIHAETLDGRALSNKVPLEVVQIREIRISPAHLEIAAGSRQKLEAVCVLADGTETSSVYLVWTESDAKVARVSASGLVYGFNPGQTEVSAGDDKSMAKEPATVTVLTADGQGRGDKQQRRGYPRVLVSGEIDVDPDTHEFRYFSKEAPPVAQDPQDVDRNIWWINSASPLARLYLDTARGYGYQSREWRMYHLERYVDVIVQIALLNSPSEGESDSVKGWIVRRGIQEAEIQAGIAADLVFCNI